MGEVEFRRTLARLQRALNAYGWNDFPPRVTRGDAFNPPHTIAVTLTPMDAELLASRLRELMEGGN